MRITGTILIAWRGSHLSDEQRAWIQQRAPEARILETHDRDEIEAELERIEIANEGVPREWLLRMPKLKWYAQYGAGVDWLSRHPEIREADFLLTNGSGIHAVPISEHIIGMMLALSRQFPRALRQQTQGAWDRSIAETTFELAGKTMVLIGVGAIGERAARLASALGMRVIGVRRHPERTAEGVERMVAPQNLQQVLPEADFLVLTIPLTPETRHMIGAAELSLLKPSARLINIGRGGTIDQDAMIEALQQDKLAGAGLDVFEQEPLPPDSPLWSMENVLITPHVSGFTPARSERAWALFSDNLERFLSDRPLRNLVDKQLGY